VNKLAELVDGVARRLGGLDQLAVDWHKRIEELQKEGRHHVVLRHYLAFFLLIDKYSPVIAERNERALNLATDEELQEALDGQLLAMLIEAGVENEQAREAAEQVVAWRERQ
jgi:hypothetical protein